MGVLTDKTLASLKRKPADAGTTYDVPDGIVPGLFARVSPKAKVTFILYTRYPGSSTPSRRAVAVYNGGNLKEARQKAREWLKLIAEGKDPARGRAGKEDRSTAQAGQFLSQRVRGLLCREADKERKGAEVERDIRINFLEPWNGRPIGDITPEDVALIIKSKAKTAPAHARNLLGEIKRLLQWAHDQHAYGLTTNAAMMLKPRALCGEKVVRERKLSDDEVFAFTRAARRMSYPWRPIYQLLLLTGLRLNEVCDARWDEIDLKNGTWMIPAARMKGRNGRARPHAVPLTPEIRAIIDSLPEFIGR